MLMTPNFYLQGRPLFWTPELYNQHLTFQPHLNSISYKVHIRDRRHTKIRKFEGVLLTKWLFSKVQAEYQNEGK